MNGRQSLAALARALAAAGLQPVWDEPMARHTSYGIGGPADLYVEARQTGQLARALELAVELGAVHFLLGAGSNLLWGDKGFRGVVIRNSCTSVRPDLPGAVPPASAGAEWRAPESVMVHVECGISLATLTAQMNALGLDGLTWAEGIPGTLGGGIVNNAGAYGGKFADIVRAVDYADGRGERGVWPAERLGLAYHTSALKGRQGPVLLATDLELRRGEPERLIQQSHEYSQRRRNSQPRGPSAGSTFRNPDGGYAAPLIEAAGMKGRRVGGAHVSEKHANFILNDQGATAQDIRALIALVQEEVFRSSGIRLEPEIEFIGEF